MKHNFKRQKAKFLVVAMAGLMVLSTAACGNNGSGESKGKQPGQVNAADETYQTPEYVYVPTYMELDSEGEYSLYNSILNGHLLQYMQNGWDEETQQSLYYYYEKNLADKSEVKLPFTLEEDFNTQYFDSDSRGNIIVLAEKWDYDEATDESSQQSRLYLVNDQGASLLADITASLKQQSMDYVQKLSVDAKGNIYIQGDSQVALFDDTGRFVGVASMEGKQDAYLQQMQKSENGDIYVSFVRYSEEKAIYGLVKVDFDKKSFGETIPISIYPQKLGTAPGNKFLISDSESVWLYDLENRTEEKLFTWVESDILVDMVEGMTMPEDGYVLATIANYDDGTCDVVTLTKTASSEISQKQVLVIGTLTGDSMLQNNVVKFNKSSDKYKLVIKSYIDTDNLWTEEDYRNGITAMNNSLTSGNVPDILVLDSTINTSNLVEKGLLEDITPFLDKSSKLHKSDYLENVVEAYTYDGKLVGLPKTFSIQTLVGDGSKIGNKKGWTPREIMDYADQNKDALLMRYTAKEDMLNIIMTFNESMYVDWKNGRCNFNTPEFKEVLEFVNRFPDQISDSDYDGNSSELMMQRGQLLLDQVYLSQFEDIQQYFEIFKGNPDFVGYPTSDGSNGCMLVVDSVYGITSKCSDKDGAWSFIEAYLAGEIGDRWSWGFPTNKTELQKLYDEKTEIKYVLDENGDPYLDENGDPIIEGGGGGFSLGDGWSFTYHVTTKEEADTCMDILKSARTVSLANNEISKMILEEAQPYFKGQKSVDQVVEIIQSRVQNYVDENM